MSLFDTLKNAIFGPAKTAAPAAPAPATPAAAPKPSATTTAAPPPSSAPPQQPVDVEAVLNGLNAKSPQKLNWQTSIVDLMKLVGMDSSLQHRKELAAELGYKGDTNDSAAMNVWLHKAVMQKLAANGGKVPDALKS
jgi:3-oxoacyl-ACP reductase-like protein